MIPTIYAQCRPNRIYVNKIMLGTNASWEYFVCAYNACLYSQVCLACFPDMLLLPVLIQLVAFTSHNPSDLAPAHACD